MGAAAGMAGGSVQHAHAPGGPVQNPKNLENPRVFFGPQDLPRLRARVAEPPYAGWYRSIRQQVDAFRRPEFYRTPGGWRRTDAWLEVRHLQRSGIAMRAAFLAALAEGDVYRELALLLLTDYFADQTEYWGDHSLHGRIIAQWALAYDFLGASLGAERPALREKLRRAAMSLYDAKRFFLAHHLLHHANNYSTRTLAGVGLCGLAIAEPVLYDTTPSTRIAQDDSWVHGLPPAGAILTTLLMHQHGVVMRRPVDPANPPEALTVPYPFPEGPGYLAYSVDLYLPFYLALRRLHPELFNPLFDLQGTPADFMRTWHLWQLSISMPDGQRPPIKDSDGGGPLGPVLSSVYQGDDAKLFYWDAMRDAGGRRDGGGARGGDIEQICFYTPPAELPPPDYQPSFRSTFHPVWGMAALRTGWGPEDLYLFVGGGKGGARLRCYQHEHADPAQFLLHAHGKLLAIDSGYGGWGDPPSDWHHEMVWEPRNHNIMLVRDPHTGEDVGPPPPDNLRMALLARIDAARLYGVDDATLDQLFRPQVREFGADTEVDRFYETERLAHCRAITSYQGLRFERDFFVVDRRWVLLVDTIRPLAALSTLDADGSPGVPATPRVIRQYLHGIGWRKGAASGPGRRQVLSLVTDGTYYTAPDELARGWNRGVWRAAAAADEDEPDGGEGPVALYAHSEAPGSAAPANQRRLTFSHGDALHASRRGRTFGQRPQRRHTYSVASLEVDFSRDAAPWLVTLLHPCADIDRRPLGLETWPCNDAPEAEGDARHARVRGLAVRFHERASLGHGQDRQQPQDTQNAQLGQTPPAGQTPKEETAAAVLYLIERRPGAREPLGCSAPVAAGAATEPCLHTDAGLVVARVAAGVAEWIAMHDGSVLRVGRRGSTQRASEDVEEVEDVAALSAPGTLVIERPKVGPWRGYVGFNESTGGALRLRVPRQPRSVTLTDPAATWRYEAAAGAVDVSLPGGTGTGLTVTW